MSLVHELVYRVATENFMEGGTNRVILATGDFSVGVSSCGTLTSMIEKKARSWVFLSVLGFGMSYNDSHTTTEVHIDNNEI